MKRSRLITALGLFSAALIALVLGVIVPYLLEEILDSINADFFKWSLFAEENGLWCILAHLGGAILLIGAFALIFRKTAADHCTRTTSLLALAFSIMASAGFACALLAGQTIYRDLSYYPYAHPTAIVAGVICLFACILLLGVYFVKWSQKRTRKGLLIDVLLTVVTFPAFFWIWYVLANGLWELLKKVI